MSQLRRIKSIGVGIGPETKTYQKQGDANDVEVEEAWDWNNQVDMLQTDHGLFKDLWINV